MDFFSTSRPSEITCLELGSATQYLKNRSALNIFHEIISSILKSQKCYANEKSSFLHLKLQGYLNKNNTTTSNKNKTGFFLLYQRNLATWPLNLAHPLSSSLALRSALL